MDRSYAININKDLVNNKAAVKLIGVVFFILAMTLGTCVSIPVPGSPIPITLQTFFVLLAGAVLGMKLSLFAVISYTLLCSSMLASPAGGFFAGFAVAALIIGGMLEKGETTSAQILLSFAAGSLIIYGAGIGWLVFAYRINIMDAIIMGALPFIAGDCIKLGAAALIYSAVSKRSRELFTC